jgi:hypothetical protein
MLIGIQYVLAGVHCVISGAIGILIGIRSGADRVVFDFVGICQLVF